MSETIDLETLNTAMNKSISEFYIATELIANALTHVHKRLERIEQWITENQKNPQKP